MRGQSAATVMEERLRKLLTGAMEEVLPLINVQELEEELNREPEAVGGESWKKWEQIVLTRLLFRMAEVVALQNLRQECRSSEEGKQQLKSGSDKGKRKQEGGEEGGGKRPKKDLQESEVVRENDPVSPSLLPGNVSGQLELDEDDQELVEVLAQMAEQAPVLKICFGPPTAESKNLKNHVNFDVGDLFFRSPALWSSQNVFGPPTAGRVVVDIKDRDFTLDNGPEAIIASYKTKSSLVFDRSVTKITKVLPIKSAIVQLGIKSCTLTKLNALVDFNRAC